MTGNQPPFTLIPTPNCDDEPNFDPILRKAAVKFSLVYRLMQMRYGTAQFPDHLHDDGVNNILNGNTSLKEDDEN